VPKVRVKFSGKEGVTNIVKLRNNMVVPQFDLQPIDIVSCKFQTETLPIIWGGIGKTAIAAALAAEAYGIKHTIVFEDHGQDFLEWDVIDGVVIDSRPFQGFVWRGTRVDMTKAAEGQLLPIITKRGENRVVMYPVIAISRTQ
jgi:hypothetical protein